jgi:hypothetical protein
MECHDAPCCGVKSNERMMSYRDTEGTDAHMCFRFEKAANIKREKHDGVDPIQYDKATACLAVGEPDLLGMDAW